ncbi:peptide/nickel transport system substrate-binding protein [Variovorax sp. PDC80]|uniref:ABC transporter substrate-binding protein n=1 Tax=Variovorax sp. PDC80 TaxID=1882827 RepID=UPI0008E7A42F|nr:ABC transporter substrate-binding protein [Variovorax sp. PDC80]SFO82364.1 peptide/nickel transport system substrate-binding protein [Variovorax sp. PDC80]
MTSPSRNKNIGPLRRRALAGAAALSALALLAAPAAWAQPRQGGTLNWLVNPVPASIVPLTTTAGGNAEIGPKIVEGLLTYDYELKPKPLLATAWSLSADGLQYTFTLRKGVKWHDGKDFTSADVAFSILTLKQVHPRGRGTFANVVEVRTPDPYTAVVVLSKPAPFLLTALAATESPIVPKHLYEGTDIAASKYNSQPIGTGPFVFKEWVQGSHIILERNPNYWDKPKPYLDRVVVRFVLDAAARAAALESGAADLANGTGGIPLSDVERFRKLPGVEIDTRISPYLGSHQQIYFNLDTPALQKVEVRRAIAQAIDVNAFAKTVWYGLGTPSASPIGKGISRYHDASIQPYPYDPKAAEAALDAAGFKRGAGGTRLKLRVLYNPFQERRAADFVRQSLGRIGIDAAVESYDFATYVTKAYTERAFDITLESLTNLFDPTVGVQRVFWSKNFKVGLPFSNAAHYVNPEVDRLLEAAAVEVDETKRRQLFVDFQQIVHRDVPSIELGANPAITVLAKKVRDYGPTGEHIRGSFADLYFQP